MFWVQQNSEIVQDEALDQALPPLRPLRLCGFTLYCIWLLMMFYSVALYDTTTDYRSLLYLNQFISLCMLVITLFVVARFVVNADKWVLSKRVIYPYTVVLVLATAAGCLVNGLNAGNIAMISVCAVCTGITSGLLFLGWFRLYADAGSRIAAMEMAAGWLLACVLVMMLFYIPRPAAIVITTISAGASGVLLRFNALKRPKRPQPLREHRLHSHTRRMFIRGVFAAACFGLIDGFSDVITGYRYVQIPLAYDVVLMAGGALVSALILLIAIRSRHNTVAYMYRSVVLCMAIGSLGTPFLEQAYSVPAALIFGGYLGFLVALAVVCTDISNYFDIHATKVIGYALASQYAGELLGLALGYGLTSFGPAASSSTLNGVTFALTGLLILSLLFLFTEKDLVETSIGEMIDAETEDQDEAATLTQDEEIAKTVALLQERCGLSARETDVLPLLIKGRTIARIQEELFISQGTVSTHIRHIYQKTGVHNRQALLDLIDDMGKGEGEA